MLPQIPSHETAREATPRARFVRTADGVLARVEVEARVSDQGLEPRAHSAVSRAQLGSQLFTQMSWVGAGWLWLEEAAKWGQSVGWLWLGRRQLHGDGPIAQIGGPLRCWEGRAT